MSNLHRISGCSNPERKADVVFIHGLGGDAFATWRHGSDDSTSWPHWMGKEFPEVGVWSLGYAASAFNLGKLKKLVTRNRDAGETAPLQDRARQLLQLMTLSGLGERPIFFICHSLGGLVAKQILRISRDSETENSVFSNTRAAMFLATPHTGADLATFAQAFDAIFGATVSIEDLREHNPLLRDLHLWYRNHGKHIETFSYFELRQVGGFTIVDATSADPAVGTTVGQDEDHISIAKPRVPTAHVCLAANRLIRDCVLTAQPRALAAAAVALTPGDVGHIPQVSAAARKSSAKRKKDDARVAAKGAAPDLAVAPKGIPPSNSEVDAVAEPQAGSRDKDTIHTRIKEWLSAALVVGVAGVMLYMFVRENYYFLQGDRFQNPGDLLSYVYIEPGSFRMGCSQGDVDCSPDERPQREVTISKGFWIGEVEVSQDAYDRVIGKAVGEGILPVSVNWTEAQRYCERVGGRLPTEAEWEYAARAGSATSHYGDLDKVAWYSANSRNGSHSVKDSTKRPNSWGLHGMLGNVWEWVSDSYDPNITEGDKVLRGGSWKSDLADLRASSRRRSSPDSRSDEVGFRCVLEEKPDSK